MAKGEVKSVDLFDGRIQAVIGDEFANRRETVMVHDRTIIDFVGRLTIKLVEHFGVIAAEPDGLDDAGRQAMKLLSPESAARRAYEIAVQTDALLQKGGHYAILPKVHQTDEQDPA